MTPRTILYTGKGGVGKTSVAAATARRLAAAGMRTGVLSTDPAPSRAAGLRTPVGGGATPRARGGRDAQGHALHRPPLFARRRARDAGRRRADGPRRRPVRAAG